VTKEGAGEEGAVAKEGLEKELRGLIT